MSESLPDQLPLPVTLNVPVSVKPGAVSATPFPVSSSKLAQWKIGAAILLLGIAVGGTLAYLILTKKIKLPWVGAVAPAIEEEKAKPTRKLTPPPVAVAEAVKEVAAAPPAAPFGSGKRWTPIDALR